MQVPGKFRGLGLVYVGLPRGTKSLQKHHISFAYAILTAVQNLILCVFQNKLSFCYYIGCFPLPLIINDATMCDLKYKPFVIQ